MTNNLEITRNKVVLAMLNMKVVFLAIVVLCVFANGRGVFPVKKRVFYDTGKLASYDYALGRFQNC